MRYSLQRDSKELVSRKFGRLTEWPDWLADIRTNDLHDKTWRGVRPFG